MSVSESIVSILIRLRDEASTALGKLGDQAKKVADDTEDAKKSSDRLGDASGRLGQNASRLAGALGMVSPAAAGAARGVADLADVGEVAAGAASGLGAVAGGVLVGALAVLAAAAPSVIGHLAVMKREAEEAAARTAFLTTHARDLEGALRGLEDAQLAAAVAAGRLSEQQAKLQGIWDAAARSVDDFRAAQEEERRAAEESYFAAQKWLQRIDVLPDALVTAIDYYAGFTSAQQEATWTLDQLDQAEADHQELVAATARAEGDATRASTGRTAAIKAQDAAEKVYAASLAVVRAALATRAQAEAALVAIIGTSLSAEERARAAYRERQVAIDAAIDAGADDNTIIEAKSASLKQLAADLKAATAAQEGLNQAVVDGTGAADVVSSLGGVASGLSGGLGGLSGALSAGSEIAGMAGATGTAAGLAAAGPIVAAIVQIIQLVTSIVPEEGETGLLDQMHDTVMEFFDDLGGLGDALGAFIVDSIREGIPALFDAIPALVDGLVDAMPEILAASFETLPLAAEGMITAIMDDLPQIIVAIVQALAESIPQVFVLSAQILVQSIGALWNEIVVPIFTGIADFFADFFSFDWVDRLLADIEAFFSGLLGGGDEPGAFEKGGWFDEAGKTIAGWFNEGFTGSHAVGSDFIHRTGMALVHEGETITPATGAGSGRAAAAGIGGRGGDVHVHLNGFAVGSVDELVRMVSRALGASQRQLAWGS